MHSLGMRLPDSFVYSLADEIGKDFGTVLKALEAIHA
jgi:hypothetical protein